jgi:hypothetical protein
MGRPHTFTVNELKRAARGLRDVGVTIDKVILEKGKIEFIASSGDTRTVGKPTKRVRVPQQAAAH